MSYFSRCGAPAAQFRIWNQVTIKLAVILVLASVISSGSALAQKSLPKPLSSGPAGAQAVPTTPIEEAPQDPLGRDAPYGTVVGFLKAAEQGNWERAAEFLDTKLPAQEKQDLARQLKLVLDRGLALNLETVSKNPLGSPTEKFRVTRNEIGTALIGGKSFLILLDRIQPTAKRPPYWLFSSETLAGVPDLASNLEAPWIEAYIPRAMLETHVFGIQIFRWIVIPLMIAIGFVLIWVVTWLLRLGAEWILRKARRQNATFARTAFLGPVRVLLLAYLVYAAAPLARTLVARQVWGDVAAGVAILGFAWGLTRALDLAVELAEGWFRKRAALHRIAPLKLAHWVLKALVIVASAALILYALGINPTTVVTGLGLGGVALAFAAQKTIENVFGTVMIVFDQPVRVGDFCKIGDATGTIEEVGLRSTRVRTLDRTVLTVPNGQLASMILENYSSRERIWFRHVIGLRYETSADQLRYVLAEIRTLLEDHPLVELGTSRVQFFRFGGSSLDLEVFAYVLLGDYPAFLKTQEEMLLRIMDIIHAAGTGFAFPSQTTYLAKDTGLDAEKGRAAIELVRKRREQGPVT